MDNYIALGFLCLLIGLFIVKQDRVRSTASKKATRAPQPRARAVNLHVAQVRRRKPRSK